MVVRKACTKCGEVKDSECFYTNPSTKNGLSTKCRVCTIAEVKEYRDKNKENFKLMMLHKIDKAKAASLANLKFNGRETKCSVLDCNRPNKVQLHHFDYTHPLDVIPLCEHHHKKLHENVWQMGKQYNEDDIKE